MSEFGLSHRMRGDSPRTAIIEKGCIIVKWHHPYSETCPYGNPPNQIVGRNSFVVKLSQIIEPDLISASEAKRFAAQFDQWRNKGKSCSSCNMKLIPDI